MLVGRRVVPNQQVERADQSLGRIVSFMRSQRFKNALEEIDSNPQALDEAESNPRGFFRGRGVDVPEDVEIVVTKGTWSICANFGFVSVCYAFD
jgi:hypothetical protein